MTDKRLLGNRLATAEMRRQEWFVTVPDGVGIDDVIQPEFWTNVTHKLTPYDLIEIGCDSCAWRLHVVVADTWTGGARVIELCRTEMTGAVESATEANGLKVQWRGPNSRWCVMDAAGQVISSGWPSKEDARLQTVNAA